MFAARRFECSRASACVLEARVSLGVWCGCFAWQAWGIAAAWAWRWISALGKELGGGSAWQVWGIVHFDVAQRAFRRGKCGKWSEVRERGVSRVRRGNGVTWCVAGHRFAWQVQGIVCGC